MQTLAKAASDAFEADISETEAGKTWPKDHILSWGAATRSILRYLSLANGVPLTTRNLAQALNDDFDLQLDDAGLSDLAGKVRHTLKALRNRTLVKRATSRDMGGYSTWVIEDSAE